jgi:predicted ester cyclase
MKLVIPAVFASVILVATSAAPSLGQDAAAQKNLKRFDTLDFDAYSKQDWKLFTKLHCADVVVHFPDGRETHGIEQHVHDIKQLFVGTPDSRITSHPIRVGSKDWTAVTGVMEATFSEPMALGNGTTQPPNGKKLKLTMATFARWKGGCIAEEFLFWDTSAYAAQLGIGR